jgi:pyruvate ferredoxin oxidoreductase gamma subunit
VSALIIEVRIHGRGGQGSVTAAEMLAVAAFKDGMYSQAFPSFGVERRGAPVRAFLRISDRKITLKSQIYEPDYIIVQDPTLIHIDNVGEGLKKDGMAIINSDKSPEDLETDIGGIVRTIDATRLAIEILGRPITNTAMIGAFVGASGLISIDAVKEAIKERFSGEMGEKNARLAEVAFEKIKVA